MSNIILHNVVHGLKLASYKNVDLDSEENQQFLNDARASLKQFSDYLSSGFKVLDSFSFETAEYFMRAYILEKDETEKTIRNFQIVSLTDVETRSSYSKSKGENFDYLRCGFGNGQFVNIFDHPDESRNTWNIVSARGWEWQEFQKRLYDGLPIVAIVTYDGEWYSLEDIQSLDDHNNMTQALDYVYRLDGPESEEDDNES